jgi:flagellar biosynthesis/type III secretory pathway M-ring protein FliF/YscJ
MENIPTEPLTFYLLVAYILVRDAIIPLLLKMLPAKQEQAQRREEHEQEIKDREILALEGINKSLSVSNERMASIETGQTSIANTLAKQSEALAVLVDRVTRKPTTRKGA